MTTDTRTPVAPASTQPTTAPARARGPFDWVLDVADLVMVFLKPISIPLLRIALGVVYVWFGALKILGLSPVAELVASMLPFLPADTAVLSMGIVEVVLGLALIAGLLVPWIAAIQVLHLLGTFAVFVFHPAVAFDGNPLFVTMEGEFIAKNLVLIAGLFVVASYGKPIRVR